MKPTIRRPALVAVVLGAAVPALGGCTFDHGAREEYRQAVLRPTGERFVLQIRVGTAPNDSIEWAQAELLEVRREAFLVATDTAILHVPVARIVVPRIDSPLSYRTRARYPYGLDEDQLAELLRAAGFARVDTIRDEPADAAPPDDDADPGDPGGPGGPGDPGDPGDLAAFLARAERAAEPYRSLDRAIAAGYRRLGPSFPGMGEHWIHPGLIVSGRVDADRPPVLCYARVDGEPRLVALAYTVPLEAGEAPPAYPAGRGVWHDHTDHVDEETLLLTHRRSHHGGAAGPRLAMFHAWIGLENPDGVLAQNNWRLPFVEAGLERPERIPGDPGDAENLGAAPAGAPGASLRPTPDAARALSLHTAGPGYYLALFRAAADPDPAELAALEAVLEERVRDVRAWADAAPAGPAPDAADLARLEGIWRRLWVDIDAAVRPETSGALAALR